MDYENLTFGGTLERILYREIRLPEEAIHKIISPSGPITVTRLEIALNNGGNYMPAFRVDVPDSLIGRKVVIKESLKTEDGIETLSQELLVDGIDPIKVVTIYEV